MILKTNRSLLFSSSCGGDSLDKNVTFMLHTPTTIINLIYLSTVKHPYKNKTIFLKDGRKLYYFFLDQHITSCYIHLQPLTSWYMLWGWINSSHPNFFAIISHKLFPIKFRLYISFKHVFNGVSFNFTHSQLSVWCVFKLQGWRHP